MVVEISKLSSNQAVLIQMWYYWFSNHIRIRVPGKVMYMREAKHL